MKKLLERNTELGAEAATEFGKLLHKKGTTELQESR